MDQELKDWIALHVMGWTAHKFSEDIWSNEAGYVIRKNEWDPFCNLNHTFMVVNQVTIKGYKVIISSGRHLYYCDIRREDYPVPADTWYAEDRESLGIAVCLAVRRMIGVW